jgi:RND family efflux transporter MFP subunit
MTIHDTPVVSARLAAAARRAGYASMLMLLAFTAACGNDDEKPEATDASHPGAVAGRDSAATVKVGAGAEEEHGDEHGENESGRVELTPAAYTTAQIAVQAVTSSPASATGEGLDVPGQVELDPRRVSLVSPRIAGRIERLSAVEGDRVGAGEVVAQLYSPEYLVAQADLTQAERRAGLLAGTPDESGARALADAARRRLRLMGVTDAEIQRVAGGGEPLATLALRAPIAGSIIEAHLLPGAAVEAGAPVFTVADLAVVDVVAEVPEAALPSVRVGQQATIGIAAYPNMRFAGDVERLRDALNPETRTVRAVIHVPNPARTLRPGMFANVRLQVSAREALGATGTVLTIPEAAIVTDGERRFVFVEVGPRAFERREVRVAPLAPIGSAGAASASVAVLDGLRIGERVVVRGAFTLKSELVKASLSDEH